MTLTTTERLKAHTERGLDLSEVTIESLWDLGGKFHALQPGCGLDLNDYRDLYKSAVSDTPFMELLDHPEKFCSGCINRIIAGPSRVLVWLNKADKVLEGIARFKDRPSTLERFDKKRTFIANLGTEVHQFKPIRAWFDELVESSLSLDRIEEIEKFYQEDLALHLISRLSPRVLTKLPGGVNGVALDILNHAKRTGEGAVIARMPGYYYLGKSGAKIEDTTAFMTLYGRGNDMVVAPAYFKPWIKSVVPREGDWLTYPEASAANDSVIETALVLYDGRSSGAYKTLREAFQAALVI